MAEPVGIADLAIRVGRGLVAPVMWCLPLRLAVEPRIATHNAPGVHSVELKVTNGRADALFRAQVREATGLQPGQRDAPWEPEWQHGAHDLDHELVRGHAGLLYIVATQSGVSTDHVPRWLEFPERDRRYRTWLAGLDAAHIPGLAAEAFVDKPVVLTIIITNRRVHRSFRYRLEFWVEQDLTIGHCFTRLHRWPRTPR